METQTLKTKLIQCPHCQKWIKVEVVRNKKDLLVDGGVVEF